MVDESSCTTKLSYPSTTLRPAVEFHVVSEGVGSMTRISVNNLTRPTWNLQVPPASHSLSRVCSAAPATTSFTPTPITKGLQPQLGDFELASFLCCSNSNISLTQSTESPTSALGQIM